MVSRVVPTRIAHGRAPRSNHLAGTANAGECVDAAPARRVRDLIADLELRVVEPGVQEPLLAAAVDVVALPDELAALPAGRSKDPQAAAGVLHHAESPRRHSASEPEQRADRASRVIQRIAIV